MPCKTDPGTTHYAGCDCHEESWLKQVDAYRAELQQLRIQLAEAQRATVRAESASKDNYAYAEKACKERDEARANLDSAQALLAERDLEIERLNRLWHQDLIQLNEIRKQRAPDTSASIEVKGALRVIEGTAKELIRWADDPNLKPKERARTILEYAQKALTILGCEVSAVTEKVCITCGKPGPLRIGDTCSRQCEKEYAAKERADG